MTHIRHIGWMLILLLVTANSSILHAIDGTETSVFQVCANSNFEHLSGLPEAIIPSSFSLIISGLLVLLLIYRRQVVNLRTKNEFLTDQLNERTQKIVQQTQELQLKYAETEAANQEFSALNEQLESAIAEANQYAVESESASVTKSRFLANMSHEIRTPMNGVLGMASVLADTELTLEQKDYLNTIQNSGEALLSIINDILDFSKIEAGKIDLENIEFNIRENVEDVLELLSPKAQEKKLELLFEENCDIFPLIIGDPTRIRQILLNLSGNAIKFTAEGEICIRLDSEKSNDGKIKMQFSVRDTGIGIPENRLNMLFQPFTQMDSSTARKFGGTGLGLAISKQLCELMGGEMWAESEEDKGTTFFFTITVEEVQRNGHPMPDISELKNKKMLIVDDNGTSRNILTSLANKWQISAKETDSGAAALELLDNGSSSEFDLVILDMQMPEMTGMQVAQQIRNMKNGTADLPLIMLSSLSDREIRDEASKLNFSRFLMKPVRQAQLLDALQEACAGDKYKQTKALISQSKKVQKQETRILLAEDNLVNQKVARLLLKKLGYTTEIAGNGKIAVEMLQKNPYDIILMDMQMPEMDGLEATLHIRANFPEEKQPIIIAMTAAATSHDQEMCMSVAMDDFISKPVKVNELSKALSNADEKLTENSLAVANKSADQ